MTLQVDRFDQAIPSDPLPTWIEQGGLLSDFAGGSAKPVDKSSGDARSRLFEALVAQGVEPRVRQSVGGYVCDLLVSGAGGETTVIIDGRVRPYPASPRSGPRKWTEVALSRG